MKQPWITGKSEKNFLKYETNKQNCWSNILKETMD